VRRSGGHRDRLPGLEIAAAGSGDHEGELRVRVVVANAELVAPEDDGVVEQRAVSLFDRSSGR